MATVVVPEMQQMQLFSPGVTEGAAEITGVLLKTTRDAVPNVPY